MATNFVHLRLHTEYALVDGLVRVKPLVVATAESGMPAVAVTDQANLFAMVKFYRAAIAQGIKPIVGVDLWVYNESDSNQPSRLVLLAQDYCGYRNLTQLVSRTYQEGQHRGIPMLQLAWLTGMTEGVIALSGGREGDVGRALLGGHRDRAEQQLASWLALFGDRYYLELQRTSREDEETYLHAAVDLAGRVGVPVVATNDVRFLRKDDFEAHEARVCITEGRTLDDPRRPRPYTAEQYLKTPAEMAELFQDLPEALENTVEIAKRCNLELELGKNYLPDFPVPPGMSLEDYFVKQSREGLEQRLRVLFDTAAADFPERRKVYAQRLQRELDVILQMGFAGYFLIVADFIQWAKDNAIPVGPGRGSGAGSLVAYVLKITDLDPIEFDLLFERFLNPERVSMPDFDIDFCMDKRDQVIGYVARKYGRDRVSQIITYGSMAAKAVVRDVGRVLGYPYGFVDRIAKLIPFEIGMTLDKALAQEEDLRSAYETEDEVRNLIALARSLEGIARNAGKHAGGVVIAPSVLTDFTPLYCEPGGGSLVTQFDKDDVEAVGLVKFDFLGLRTLTIIDWAVKAIDRQRPGEEPLDISRLAMDDKATFGLLQACQTTAVFQLESRGMKDLIKRLQPDCFEDIIALVALFRPGPLQSGMVDDFIDRKQGRAKVEYPHPALEPILKPTYGVILYQEQVMQIAQVLAGYTLGGADLLRRAMGKKKPEAMAEQRAIFTNGAVERGADAEVATYIFDLMEKFAGYGFNKSHSAAYALLSYQTAWLKAHYPAAFMAAVLSADMDNTDKVVTLIEECRTLGLEVMPPNVNESAYAFTERGPRTVMYGLGAIKGVGEGAIEGVIAERKAHGSYTDLLDFCRRIDLRKANRRVLEALIRAGALDTLGRNRATLIAHLPTALQSAEQHLKMAAAGQDDLFGLDLDVAHAEPALSADLQAHEEWDEQLRLQGEKETLGLYLTGHPICEYETELARFTTGRIAELSMDSGSAAGDAKGKGRAKGTPVIVAGLVVALRTMQSQKGNRMGFLTLDDRSGRIEVAVFGGKYQEYRDLLAKDKLLVVEGGLSVDEYRGGLRISAERILGIDQARGFFAKQIVIGWDARSNGKGGLANGEQFLPSLEDVLTPFREGNCPIWVDYRNASARTRIHLGQKWWVHPTDVLMKRLRHLTGDDGVRIEY